jgi:hypothetical protein
LPGFHELERFVTDLGAGRQAFVIRYDWHPQGQTAPVRQIQVSFLDCAVGYVFTASTAVSDWARDRPLFAKALVALAGIS